MDPRVNYSPDLTMVDITKKLFNHQFLSDVQFLVDDKVVYAHSLILMMRSIVFENQLQVTLGEQKLIPINDVKYDSVYQLVRFIYTDKCTITSYNALELFKLAKRYKVIKLENWVVGSFSGPLMNLILFEHCLVENDQFHLVRSRTGVLEHLPECLKTDRFVSVEPAVVQEILKFDCANISEFQLFEALARWITENSKFNRIDKAQQSTHYGDLIRWIRFPVMSPDEIFTCTEKYPHLFTDSDYRSLFKIIAKSSDNANNLWNGQLRATYSLMDTWIKYPKKENFATKFTVSREMLLIGLQCGGKINRGNAQIRFSQRNGETNCTEEYTMTCIKTPNWTTSMINLGESIRVRPNMEFTIEFDYCVTTEEMSIACRTQKVNLNTNIQQDVITFNKAGRNIFDLFFRLLP